jgi:threonine/homoserine/homoserine lactone efflux protein
VSFVVAIIIFFNAIFSDFSVRMYYSSTNWSVQIIIGLLAIVLITFAIMVLLFMVPELRRAFSHMSGIDKDN